MEHIVRTLAPRTIPFDYIDHRTVIDTNRGSGIRGGEEIGGRELEEVWILLE